MLVLDLWLFLGSLAKSALLVRANARLDSNPYLLAPSLYPLYRDGQHSACGFLCDLSQTFPWRKVFFQLVNESRETQILIVEGLVCFKWLPIFNTAVFSTLALL